MARLLQLVGICLCGALGITSALAAPSAAGRAPGAPAWQLAAATLPAANLVRNATVVPDPLASGGQAVRITYDKAYRGTNVQVFAPALAMQGRTWITVYLRGENLPPITDPMRITLVAHDLRTNLSASYQVHSVYGVRLKATGYTAIRVPLDTSYTATQYAAEIDLGFIPETAGAAPVVYFDKVEVSPQTYTAPVIAETYVDKLHYAPADTVTGHLTLTNPTAAAAEVTVIGEELRALTSRREVFRQTVSLAAGETKPAPFTYQLGPEEYGRELRVSLQVAGKEVAADQALFAVSQVPLAVSVANYYDRSQDSPDMHTIFYVAPATGQESWRSVLFFKKMLGSYCEFFSWSPGDITDLSPAEDPFLGGEGRAIFRSRETIRQQLRMLKSVGFWPVSYVNGSAWADSGYQLFQEHPEWFLYDGNGEVAHYEMDSRETYRHRGDYNFDPNSYPGIFFQAVLNHSLPEVQRYIADQYIKCAKEMGFNGVRMDVRYLEIYPGERGFDGKEIAPTFAEADKLSAQNVRNIKAMVHQEIPTFTFGYNYSSPDETKDMRLTMQERCAGGAWMLDEIPATYQEKTSPYHIWKAYVRRMTSWGDQVRKWGGVYNPFDFRRGGSPYVVDNVYSAIIRLMGGGHFACYTNGDLPFGDLGGFGTRFSEYLYGTNLDWISAPQSQVTVKAAAPLWWEDSCYWSKSAEGKKQLIVHLLNPPAVAEVEENPQSKLSPPVTSITVACAPVAGAKPTAAYLLASEPDNLGGANNTRVVKLELKDVGGKATVTVPSVLFWKTVIFQW
ncbi:MAG TPA: hypothetical protein VGM19_15000 [Armatimonadota bacterium]